MTIFAKKIDEAEQAETKARIEKAKAEEATSLAQQRMVGKIR